MSDRTVCEHYKQGYREEYQAEADAWDRHQADLNMTIVEQYAQIDSLTQQVEELKFDRNKYIEKWQSVCNINETLNVEIGMAEKELAEAREENVEICYLMQVMLQEKNEAEKESDVFESLADDWHKQSDNWKEFALRLQSKLQIAVKALEETLKAHHPNYGVCHAIALEALGKIRGEG